jgi:hypothetical protein
MSNSRLVAMDEFIDALFEAQDDEGIDAFVENVFGASDGDWNSAIQAAIDVTLDGTTFAQWLWNRGLEAASLK